MIEVVIDSIRVSLVSQQRIVMLRDADGEQQLAIFIGPCEAEAITIELQETEMARPMTHDLLRNIVDQLGANISHILINDLADQVFHAQLHIETSDGNQVIDCRPSDAIALAVRAKATIYVAEAVMDEAGMSPEPDIAATKSAEFDDAESDTEPVVSDAELDAFRSFLDNLDDEDEA